MTEMTERELLVGEERALVKLRSLYKSYGYLPYKMSKFEEYDLYAGNKDFLVSDRVITFNDTDGKLLALKPDVTLSIIKNSVADGEKRKVYYNENVYRVSKSTGQFKEIMQAGLECIGEVDITDVFEVVTLAARSLECISPDYVLDLSHMGILSALLSELPDSLSGRISSLIADKNAHELTSLCAEQGISPELAEALVALASLYGSIPSVLERLLPLCKTEEVLAAYAELSSLCELIMNTGLSSHVRLDFSVVNNMSYYNGIVFRGFLSGISEGVLAGGEYGRLLSGMHRSGDAIGFAIYLDLISELLSEARSTDVDVLLLYKSGEEREMLKRKEELISTGKSVLSSKIIPKGIRYGECVTLGGDENA